MSDVTFEGKIFIYTMTHFGALFRLMKSNGPDGISGHTLILCDYSVTLPVRIIFNIIPSTATYADMWKLANVTPIYKKGDK